MSTTSISILRSRVCIIARELIDLGVMQSEAMSRAWRAAKSECPHVHVDCVDVATSSLFPFDTSDIDTAIDLCDVHSQVYGDRHFYRIYDVRPGGHSEAHVYAPDMLIDGFSFSHSHVPASSLSFCLHSALTSRPERYPFYSDMSFLGSLRRLGRSLGLACMAVSFLGALACALPFLGL